MEPMYWNLLGFVGLIVAYATLVVVKFLMKKTAHKAKMAVLYLKGDKDA